MAETTQTANPSGTSAAPTAAPMAASTATASGSTEAASAATPTQSASTQTQTPAEPEKLTAEKVQEFGKKRDLKSLRELTSRKTKTAQTAQPAAQTPIQTPDTKTDAASTTTQDGTKADAPSGPVSNKYVVGMGEGKLELHDDDGFLGYKDADGLKKALANNVLYNRTQKRWTEEQIARAVAAEQRAAQLEAQLKESQTKQAAAPVGMQPQTTASQSVALPKVDLQTVPERPDLPADPATWTEAQANAYTKWEKDMAEAFNRNFNAVNTVLAKVNQNGGNLDASNPVIQNLAAQLAEMNKAVTEFKSIAADVKAQKTNLAVEQEQRRFWDGVEQFASLHGDEFKAPAPLRDLHKQIVDDGQGGFAWMDMLAYVNGVQRPIPTDEAAWKTYIAQRAEVTQKYLAGDKDVIAKAEANGAVPPKGYREYFEASDKVNTLIREKNRLVQQGVLGSNASLQQVWHVLNESNLEPQIRQLEQAVRIEQTQKVVDALKQHQAEHAVAVPPEMAQSGTAPLSADRVKEILEKAKMRDPQAIKELRELTDQLKSAKLKGRKR